MCCTELYLLIKSLRKEGEFKIFQNTHRWRTASDFEPSSIILPCRFAMTTERRRMDL